MFNEISIRRVGNGYLLVMSDSVTETSADPYGVREFVALDVSEVLNLVEDHLYEPRGDDQSEAQS